MRQKAGRSRPRMRVTWVPPCYERSPLRVLECRRVSVVHHTVQSRVEHAPTSLWSPAGAAVVPRSGARGEGTRKRSAAGRGLLNLGVGFLVWHLSRMARLRVFWCRRVSVVHLTGWFRVEPSPYLPSPFGRWQVPSPTSWGTNAAVVPRSGARGEGTRKRSAAGRCSYRCQVVWLVRIR